MHRYVLVALTLLPGAIAATPADGAPESFPRGKVIIRPECFGYMDLEESATGASSSGRQGRRRNRSGGFLGGARKSAPPPPAAPAMEMAEEAPADIRAPEPQSMPITLDDDGDGVVGEIDYGDEIEVERYQTPEPERDVSTTLEWGRTVYLSNDDSMSLASAQRVLFAAMNGMRPPLQQIRPHELLNYFTFRTATPDGDQLFDVMASAERQGDTLAVALAVKGTVPQRDPLDLTLLIDRSCSMEAEGRMNYTKRGLTLMAEQLRRGDRVDVVLFDDTVCAPVENYVVGRDDPSILTEAIRAMQPEGATDLDLGLRKAYDIAKGHLDTRDRNRRVMVLTDAMLNTGDVNHDTVSEIGRAFEQDEIRVTGVGVGREFNDEVLDMLTEKGKGAYVYLGSEAVVDRIFGADGFASLVQTIAHDVQFALHLPDSLAMERFYGEESSTDPTQVQPINYYAGTTQLFLQDLRVRGGDRIRNDKVGLEITYRNARTGKSESRWFHTTIGKMLESDPHNVRKGRALIAWADMLIADAMGAGGCGEELATFVERASALPDDSEVAFVRGLVENRCGPVAMPEGPGAFHPSPRVELKVRIDADEPITDASLECGSKRWSQSLTGSDRVARFDAYPGRCQLTLQGRVDHQARIEVPSTGSDIRCVIRRKRIRCN